MLTYDDDIPGNPTSVSETAAVIAQQCYAIAAHLSGDATSNNSRQQYLKSVPELGMLGTPLVGSAAYHSRGLAMQYVMHRM